MTAHSTLGFIFGLQSGRPGWFSALQAPGFVVMAGVSGIGIVLIVVSALLRKVMHLEDLIQPVAFRWLGNFLWMPDRGLQLLHDRRGADQLLRRLLPGSARRPRAGVRRLRPALLDRGRCLLAPLAILFMQFVRKQASIPWTVAAGLSSTWRRC